MGPKNISFGNITFLALLRVSSTLKKETLQGQSCHVFYVICRREQYDWCNFADEYMFLVEKSDTNLSNKPLCLPPELAKMSPNLSHVQCGRKTVFGLIPWLSLKGLCSSLHRTKGALASS